MQKNHPAIADFLSSSYLLDIYRLILFLAILSFRLALFAQAWRHKFFIDLRAFRA
jgi:hypothetical protein